MIDESISNNKRTIMKNSLLLYGRMLIMMCLNLLLSRVVLRTLGVEDYGIYNLVGGLVVFIAIINAGMMTATQRFLNIGLGKQNIDYLRSIFRTSCLIHFLLAILIILIAETIGVYFLSHELMIPIDKMNSAKWVFQVSLFTTILQIICLPYNSTVIAHEKMSVFASITVLQAALTLCFACCLYYIPNRRLEIYATMILGVQIIVSLCYAIYCIKNFEECSLGPFKFDKRLFKRMMIFSSWCLVGCAAGLLYTQGLNVLLGMFFQPFVNAARGLAVTVQNAVNQVYNNVQNAVVPQLIQSYAREEYDYFLWLLFKSSKYFSFLLLIFAIPIWIRTPYILNLWLGEIPEYTVLFIRILLCISLIDAISGPLMRASDATGDIKKYHMLVGGILILIVPISYVYLKLGYPPQSAFYVYLAISCCALIARLIVLHEKIKLNIQKFLLDVICPVITVSSIAFAFSWFGSLIFVESFLGFILFFLSSIITTSVIILLIGITKIERDYINNKVHALIRKI